jgi:hypothetical protein
MHPKGNPIAFGLASKTKKEPPLEQPMQTSRNDKTLMQ